MGEEIQIQIRQLLQYFLIAAAIATVVLSPVLVGVVPLRYSTLLAIVAGLLVFSIYALSPFCQSLLAKKVALSILSVSFTLSCLDIVSRPLLARFFDYRPDDTFLEFLPSMPLVLRFVPNVHYVGQVYGDLAAIAGDKSDREYRSTEFVTDRFGFRNDPSTVNPPEGGLDVIVLGDSIAMGSGTSQEQTLAQVLVRDYRLSTYNLSTIGSPWQEFVNLTMESDRLPVKARGTVLLWMIFTGNDLDERCHPVFDKARLLHPCLPWMLFTKTDVAQCSHTALERASLLHLCLPVGMLGAFRNFAAHSTIAKMASRLVNESPRGVLAADFSDGRKVLFYSAYVEASRRSYSEVLEHQNFRCLECTIAAMKKLADTKKLAVFVVLVPTKEEVYSWVLERRRPWSTPPVQSGFSLAVEQICRRDGIRFFDLKPYLIDYSKRVFEEKGGLLWWRDDTHWNEQGHKAVAEIVYDHLLRDLK